MDHRDGGLAAARDHVGVGRAEVLAEVGGWDHHGTDGRGRQVDGDDAGGLVLGRVVLVHVCAGGLEEEVGLLAAGLDGGEQFVSAAGHADEAVFGGALHTLGFGVDADHPFGLDVLTALELVHQVGADVAGPHDRCCELGLLCHESSVPRGERTPQTVVPLNGTTTWSGGAR